MRKSIVTLFGAAALIVSLTACGVPLDETAQAPKPAATEEPAAAAEPVAEPEPEPVATPEAPPAPDGSFTMPFPKGTPVGNDQVTILLGDVQWDANALIYEENQFNDVAPAGQHYVLLSVSAQNLADPDPIAMWLDVDVKFVAPDGRSFDSASAVIPGDLSDVGDLYPGGTGVGNVAFLLPDEVLGTGMFAVSYNWSDEIFVSAV